MQKAAETELLSKFPYGGIYFLKIVLKTFIVYSSLLDLIHLLLFILAVLYSFLTNYCRYFKESINRYSWWVMTLVIREYYARTWLPYYMLFSGVILRPGFIYGTRSVGSMKLPLGVIGSPLETVSARASLIRQILLRSFDDDLTLILE